MNNKKSFMVLLIIFIISFCIFCSEKKSSDQASDQVSDPAFGRIISPPVPDTDEKIKILVYYDMEGISGQNEIRSLSYGNAEYEPAREWLTNDVNAVITGLFAGGADVVHVVDAHGSGNPQPDILLDKMDPRAEMINKDKSFRPYIDLTEKNLYDAVAVVCMHSRTGGGGFAAHTYTLGMDWIVNDMSINETEIIGYSWGQVDVPVIFASGDDKLEEQLKWMTWLEYVRVKTAKGAGDADLRPFEDVHSEMSIKAKRAVENISKAMAVKLTTPVKAQLRAVYPANLKILDGVPGIDYHDHTVTFQAVDYQAAYDGIVELINVATSGYARLLQDTAGEQDNSEKIFREFREKLFQRWVEVESGTWSPPEPVQQTGTKMKYFGAR